MKYLNAKSIQDFLKINNIIKTPTPPCQIEGIKIIVKSKKGENVLELDSKQLKFQKKNKDNVWKDCPNHDNDLSSKYGMLVTSTVFKFITKFFKSSDAFKLDELLKMYQVSYEFMLTTVEEIEKPVTDSLAEEVSRHTIPSFNESQISVLKGLNTSALDHDLQFKDKEITYLKEQLANESRLLNEAIQDKEKQIELLKQLNEKSGLETNQVMLVLQGKEQALAEVQAMLEQSKINIKIIQDNLQDKIVENQHLLDDLNRSHLDQKEAIIQLQSQLDHSKVDLADLRQLYEAKHEQLLALQEKFFALQNSEFNLKIKLTEEINQQKAVIANLNKDLDTSQFHLKTIKEQKEQEKHYLQEQLEHLRQEKQTLVIEQKQLREELQNKEKALLDLNQTICQKDLEVNGLKTQTNKLTGEVQATIDHLKQKEILLQNQQATMEKLNHTMKSLEQDKLRLLKNQEAEVEKLNQTINILNKKALFIKDEKLENTVNQYYEMNKKALSYFAERLALEDEGMACLKAGKPFVKMPRIKQVINALLECNQAKEKLLLSYPTLSKILQQENEIHLRERVFFLTELKTNIQIADQDRVVPKNPDTEILDMLIVTAKNELNAILEK